MYLFKKRFLFDDNFFLFDEDLSNLEELYVDCDPFEPFPRDEYVLDLSSLPRLNNVYYKYHKGAGDYNNAVTENSKLIVNNGHNIENNLMTTIWFNRYTHYEGDSVKYLDRFHLCLDDNVTNEFLENNIVVKSVNGIQGYEVITINCEL